MTGHDLVVVANRPQRDTDLPDGPGTVAALRPVVRDRGGIWICGAEHAASLAGSDATPDPIPVHPVRLSGDEIRSHDWQSAAAIWPTYHDAVRQPTFRPDWRAGYRQANSRARSTPPGRAG